MVNNLELIEAYFNEELSQEKINEVERRITEDPAFAEEAAFYVSSKQVAAAELEESRSRLKEAYQQYKQGSVADVRKVTPLRRLWPWVAAAAVMAGVIFGWYTFFQPVSPAQLADKYITQNFQTLPVEMGASEDSVQAAMKLYNEGRAEEALDRFEYLVIRDTSFTDAKKYAGIISLKLGHYDKAISYFSQLSNQTLYANPGTFYYALTLMKRNGPGDKERARQLLQQVVDNNLDKKKEAEKWLKRW